MLGVGEVREKEWGIWENVLGCGGGEGRGMGGVEKCIGM